MQRQERRGLLCARPFAADELAPAFGHDLVDAMPLAARVVLRTIDLVPKPGDRHAVDGVHRRAADDFAAVVRGVADDDDFVKHVGRLPVFQEDGLAGFAFQFDGVVDHRHDGLHEYADTPKQKREGEEGGNEKNSMAIAQNWGQYLVQ